MEMTTKTRKTKTFNRRELRTPIKAKELIQLKKAWKQKKCYGKGRELFEETGITYHQMGDAIKKGIAKPSVLKKIKSFFNL